MRYRPDDLISWLSFVDVNALSDADQKRLAAIDPASTLGMRALIQSWIRPRFAELDAQNQREFKEMLAESREWPEPAVSQVFSQIAYPGHELDPPRFLAALRATFLD